ncbi:hypothetical protein [Botrimarina hoheduenensis]|uniref:Uncharacterized protein n=1 Tax=Botrimarina hoheduenensis TaxID=2528000 RepID=A0A5C5W8B0_9BACT|nr:hypothetical protein [Botrimarina hoheduenensis]TWT46493.1 hypothetical protein Pla111_15890 [Botrimarina hoheduenensis]
MAAGDTLLTGGAMAGFPLASGARLDLRNGQPVLDFTDAAEEAVDFQGVMPAHYAGGSLLLRMAWSATVATAGQVRWGIALERRAFVGSGSPHDLDSDAFGTEVLMTSTAPAVSGQLQLIELTLPGVATTGLVGGEGIRLRVRRLGSAVEDTMNGDAEFVALELREEA